VSFVKPEHLLTKGSEFLVTIFVAVPKYATPRVLTVPIGMLTRRTLLGGLTVRPRPCWSRSVS
jgi:hypothetical protein